MKIILILAMLMTTEIQAQSLADAARAERKRRESIKSVTTIQKLGDSRTAVVRQPAPATGTEEITAEPEEPTLEKKLQSERVDLIKERSALLVRLSETKNNPEASKAIEAQLIELSKRAETLKLQHLNQEVTSFP